MIPIYKIVINDEETGIDRISLVKYPAVESNFLAFEKNEKKLTFKADEEQKIIMGVLARADYPIYRYDTQIGEYYIQFSKEVIKELAEKLLSDNHQNWVNIEHKKDSDVDGVNMIQMFIKDKKKGINPDGFDDISDGSLFATFKVHNEDIWKEIKNGTFKGFSVEGLFGFEKIDEDEDEKLYDEIMDLIKTISKLR